ncbi:MAG: beta-lactamase family protein, partial [Flavobacteriaceae bacterium]|nr:beta-lactamase family protein [Flavobacteriaceae bacterium]
PDQVHEPGSVHSYSNFGYALLGYLIQEISGIPYEVYIRTQILEPLGMSNTDLTQPLPETLRSNLARSYIWQDEQIYLPRDYTNTTPGGGIVSNAVDMSKYMLMLLNGGKLNDTRLLNSDSFEQLTSQQYGSRQTKYGICYAFFENMWTTRRSLDHTGGQLGFVSLMVLIPETGTGIFIAQNNRKGAGSFRYDVMIPFLDSLLGEKKRDIAKITPPENFDKIAKNYVGRYKQKNYPKATFEKLARFFGAFTTEYWVSYKGEGIMDIRGTEYIMVDEHLFQMNDKESTHKMEFKVDDKGKAQELMIGTTSYERVPWYKFKRVLQFSLIVSMIMLLLHVVVNPIRRIIRKRRLIADFSETRPTWISKWQYLTALLYVLGTIGVAILFAYYQDQMSDYGVPFVLKVILLIYTMAFILACLFPIVLWKSLTIKSLSPVDRLKDLIIVLAIVITSLTLYHFNMIGFQYY